MPIFTSTLPKTAGGTGNNPDLCSDYCRTGQGQYRNIFFVGETISFPLFGGPYSDQTSFGAPGTPASWEIRHGITGAVVASGGALATVTNGSTWTPLSGGSPLTSLPCGPYVVAFSRSSSIATWGTDQGGGMFVVVRNTAGFPTRPATTLVNPGQDDIPLHGLLNMGTVRFRCDPRTQANFPQLDGDVPNTASYVGQDSARPAPLLMAFAEYNASAGQNTNVAAAVARYPAVTRFEGTNEPSTQAWSGTTFAPAMSTFASTVKGARSSATVVGPAPVVLGGTTQGLLWLADFAAAGGYAYCDEISVHTYNGTLGDLTLARRTWDGFIAHLTTYGQQNKPRWVTEGGDFWVTSNGSGTMVKQQQQLALDLMVCEQYGVPKERYIYYYDQMAGNELQPGHLLNYMSQPSPAVAMFRCYSEELRGAVYESRLDFGTVENNWLIGSTFRRSSDSTGVAVLMSCGLPGHQVKLRLAGATLPGSLTVIDSFGNSSTAAIAGGIVTVTTSDTGPVYVRLPANVTATAVATTYGWDIAKSEPPSTTRNPGGIYKINDGQMRNPYYYDTDGPDPDPGTDDHTAWNGLGTDSGTAEYAQVTFGHAQTFDTIVIQSPYPQHRNSTLLDFDVQWLDADNVTWHTIATYTKTPLVVTRNSTWYDRVNSFTETYDNFQHVWRYTFTKIKSKAVRVYIRACTAGGEATPAVTTAGGGSGQGWVPTYPYIQSVRVFNNAEAVSPTVAAVRVS